MTENPYYAPDYEFEALKVPPSSVPAEQSVLGGLMLDNQAWDMVADKVVAVDFYRKDHRLIFNAIADLADKQEPFDIVTLSERLKLTGQLQEVGGMSYLAVLLQDTPSAANIGTYADIVRNKAILRQLIHAGTNIADSGFNPKGEEVNVLLENAEKLVFQIAEQRQHGQTGLLPIKVVLAQTVNKLESLYQRKGGLTGFSTGYIDLDTMTSGLQASDLIIIAGRPSMGKTTIAVNIAESIAMETKQPVAIFSMEMPADSITMRMLSSLGGIEQQRVRTGQLSDEDWARVTSTINLLKETKLFIDDTPALTPAEVRSRSRRLAREHGQLALIVVDYLQLMQSPGSGDSRVQQISDISRGLKALAKELNVPVVALSQLNRNLEQRPNKRPLMSDLRESGGIEQDADLILFVYRDEVYNPETTHKGRAELIIGKQRNGPIGTVNLNFLGQYTRFENLAREAYVANKDPE